MSLAEAVERTREQVQLLEQYCHEIGRNPADIRRSVLPYRTETDQLASLDAFDEFVGRYAALGFREFVFYWPPVTNLQRHEPHLSVSASDPGTNCRAAIGDAPRIIGRNREVLLLRCTLGGDAEMTIRPLLAMLIFMGIIVAGMWYILPALNIKVPMP